MGADCTEGQALRTPTRLVMLKIRNINDATRPLITAVLGDRGSSSAEFHPDVQMGDDKGVGKGAMAKATLHQSSRQTHLQGKK